MKTHIFQLVIAIFWLNFTYSQKIIEMEKINGTYQVPCKVNGIPMNFIFDTGATDVTISVTEAKFLLKQGLITKEDFIQNTNYQIANGDIIEGTKIHLKTIEIDGIILKNIPASIIYQQNAPLLLGQSAIEKLGKYSIDDNKLIINNFESKEDEKAKYTKEIYATFDWINEMVGVYSYSSKDEILEYNMKILENEINGFTIYGTLNNANIFAIPIHKISDIQYLEDSKNSDILHLILLNGKGDFAFFINGSEESNAFSFFLNKSTFINEKMDDRFNNAFSNLIKYNKLLIELKEKF
jgi:clan AA aspartic protease (TIGR02281 family)